LLLQNVWGLHIFLHTLYKQHVQEANRNGGDMSKTTTKTEIL